MSEHIIFEMTIISWDECLIVERLSWVVDEYLEEVHEVAELVNSSFQNLEPSESSEIEDEVVEDQQKEKDDL